MRILFLDDDGGRRRRFLAEHPSAVTVATARECIQQLENGPWTTVHLDHDLGGEIFVDSSREDCGMEVVRWMEKHKPAVGEVVVHTLNRRAGAEMVRLLGLAGYDARLEPWDADGRE